VAFSLPVSLASSRASNGPFERTVIALPIDKRERTCRGAKRANAADDDGVIVVDGANVRAVLDAAADIARRERAQADRVRKGVSLRQQFRFTEYLARRVEKPDYTFREHLASLGAAVEV